MNELQRQVYLSALGVDTYMPRWHLPCAPVSVQCSLPESSYTVLQKDDSKVIAEKVEIRTLVQHPQSSDYARTGDTISPINNLINDISTGKKIAKAETPLKKEDIQPPPHAISLPAIEAFSLSVWRPLDELMIVDARNTKLALPTDALLKNILHRMFAAAPLNFKEEVLRCPMIENSFAKRTAEDARAELQTWLSVQCEIRPVKYLWLMGSNSYSYLTSRSVTLASDLWHSCAVAGSRVEALVLPALNELLINPALKKQLYTAIRRYHC